MFLQLYFVFFKETFIVIVLLNRAKKQTNKEYLFEIALDKWEQHTQEIIIVCSRTC